MKASKLSRYDLTFVRWDFDEKLFFKGYRVRTGKLKPDDKGKLQHVYLGKFMVWATMSTTSPVRSTRSRYVVVGAYSSMFGMDKRAVKPEPIDFSTLVELSFDRLGICKLADKFCCSGNLDHLICAKLLANESVEDGAKRIAEKLFNYLDLWLENEDGMRSNNDNNSEFMGVIEIGHTTMHLHDGSWLTHTASWRRRQSEHFADWRSLKESMMDRVLSRV